MVYFFVKWRNLCANKNEGDLQVVNILAEKKTFLLRLA